MSLPVRLIAFYLPQFHPIPENDYWWGEGFTEWTNVSKAKPLFPGHYQPHLPADLGFYDLRVDEVRNQQAAMAREYGIYGFCYYYYYFGGKRLLQHPMDRMIESGTPDFPFCVCWANENWNRRWDGFDDDMLIEQYHSDHDDVSFIRGLIPAFSDKRYIRVNGKLLMLIYRVDLLPDPLKTSAIWRETIKKELGEELYLCAMNGWVKEIDPERIGFDATVQFPLDINHSNSIDTHLFALQHQVDPETFKYSQIFDYQKVVNYMTSLPKPYYKFFRGAFPSWDNTPRRQKGAKIFVNASPEYFKLFLNRVINLTLKEQEGEERLVFLNAWNEWAEGAHLEPDQEFGRKWLEAVREALDETVGLLQITEGLKAKLSDDHDIVAAIDLLEILLTEREKSLLSIRKDMNDTHYANIFLQQKLDTINKSWTFRIGRFFLWIPIKLYGLIKR
jgi:lipopolysaccharide biosynthesis protein